MTAERDALKWQYGKLFAAISEALFEADPVGINFGISTAGYEPEVGTIIPRRSSAQSAEDAQAIIHEESLPLVRPRQYWAKREVCSGCREGLDALVELPVSVRVEA